MQSREHEGRGAVAERTEDRILPEPSSEPPSEPRGAGVKSPPEPVDAPIVHSDSVVIPDSPLSTEGPPTAPVPPVIGRLADPLARLGLFVVAAGTVILFWKLHGFKLPSEIDRERAQNLVNQGKSATGRLPRTTFWTSLTDWITPWRWGRGDLLKNTTATGGDMGAHIWTPDVVKRSILTKGRLTGWSDDWYRGMPVLGFYFPLPSLMIAFLSFVVPYGIAFKLITVLGICSIPTTAWAAGKLAGLKRPIPVFMALAAIVFVLGRNYDLQIYGGNILSTMAGEFSFSISLSLSILFLGLFTRVVRTGEMRGRAALVLAATGLCHLLPTVWVLLVAAVLLLTHLDGRRLRPKNSRLLFSVLGGATFVAALAAIGIGPKAAIVVLGATVFGLALADQVKGLFGLTQLRDAVLVLGFGGATAGFWLVPFASNLDYSNDMGWEKMRLYIANLFPFWAKKPPGDAGLIAIAMILALCGAAAAILSIGRAMAVRAKATGGWSPLLFPVATFLSLLVALLVGAIHSSFPVALFAFAGGLLFTFLMAMAATEPVVWRRLSQAIATAVLAVAGVTQWAHHPGYIVLAAIATIAIILVVAAFNGLEFERWPLALLIVVGACVSVFVFSPQFRLWNARVLPFWFMSILLLAAYGAVSMVRGFSAVLHWYGEPRRTFRRAPVWGTLAASVAVFIGSGMPINLVPDKLPVPSVKKGRIGIQQAVKSTDASPITGWSGYNFKGYEGQTAWPDYKALMDEANRVGKTVGCGTAMWEYDDARLNSFGTTLSLMLLPYWTKSCIGSVEGVYFESSATAPSHWLNAALTTAPAENNPDGSKKTSGPSNPQRDLPYHTFEPGKYEIETGIAKLEKFGVRYYIAMTEASKKLADVSPQLIKVGASGVFSIYELNKHDVVSPLTEEPVVVTGVKPDQNGGWLDVEVDAYGNELNYPANIVASGPKEWQRIAASVTKPKGIRTYGVGVTITNFQRKVLPAVKVTDIKENNVDINFTVDKIGVPVVVKTSYFPNWTASGAKGPYRVMPNFMVVIPTSKHVSLHYGYSHADIAGHLATITGLAGAFWLHRTRKRTLLDDETDDGRPHDPLGYASGDASGDADHERVLAMELPASISDDQVEAVGEPVLEPVGSVTGGSEPERTTAPVPSR